MSMSHGDLWFQWMWIFLATAPLGALLLGQWPRASTLWASAFGALGSLAGIGASLIVLGGSGGGLRWTIDTALPFLTADICLDALAAFFLFCRAGPGFTLVTSFHQCGTTKASLFRRKNAVITVKPLQRRRLLAAGLHGL